MLSHNLTYIDDLRFALEVMNEHFHLGFDSEHASKLRVRCRVKSERSVPQNATASIDPELTPRSSAAKARSRSPKEAFS